MHGLALLIIKYFPRHQVFQEMELFVVVFPHCSTSLSEIAHGMTLSTSFSV